MTKQELLSYAQGHEASIKFINKLFSTPREKLDVYSLDQGEVEHVIDYLRNHKQPEKVITLSYKQLVAKSKKWIDKMNKSAGKVVELDEDVKHYMWASTKKEGYRFVELVGKNAFVKEGQLMSHCLSNYYGKSDVKIYSLRDASNKPHATIEIYSSGEINQIKGKGNGSIHPRYIKYVLKFLKKVAPKMQIRDSEMNNLGYISIPDEIRPLFKKCYKGVKFFQKKYAYKGDVERANQAVFTK